MNRVEPAHVPGSLKCLIQPALTWKYVKNRGKPGRYRLILGTSVSPPGLYRDKLCMMKTPGVPGCWAGRAMVKNGRAPVCTGGDRDCCTRIVPVPLRLSPGLSRFKKVCAG